MKSHPSEGRSFSEYSWGGYLVWHLPEDKVFVDGRTDLFGDEIIGEWRQVVQAEENNDGYPGSMGSGEGCFDAGSTSGCD